MKNYLLYQVETTGGKEWIARFLALNNCGGSGKTQKEALLSLLDNMAFEIELEKQERTQKKKSIEVYNSCGRICFLKIECIESYRENSQYEVGIFGISGDYYYIYTSLEDFLIMIDEKIENKTLIL